MINKVDRVQLVVPDAGAAMQKWVDLFDAEAAGKDRVAALAANRRRLRLGRGWVEFLEPDGAGPVDTALRQRGPHMFAAGLAAPDLGVIRKHFVGLDLQPISENNQIYLLPADTGGHGLRAVISQDEDLPAVGLLDHLYEATLLVEDAAQATAEVANLFALDTENFVAIGSKKFGYDGSLTLFRARHLHRFEVIHPGDPGNTMGRFFQRTGESYYMAFAETPHMLEIEARAKARGDGITIDRPTDRGDDLMADQMWLHPAALGGMMLGLSRPSRAWHWSGSPERVTEI